MRSLTIRTNKEKLKIQTPERLGELSCEQFQDLLEKWDFEDWIDGFSIVTGLEVKEIKQSKDGSLEGALYETIAFLFDKKQWDALDKLPIPKEFEVRPIWSSDCDLITPTANLKKIGRFSIEQAIQARKHLEGVRDLRQGLSMVTAIYLQPILDQGKTNHRGEPMGFDMAEVSRYEVLISKMYIERVYPLGFFLLRKLNGYGMQPLNVWSLVLNLLQKLKRL